MRDQNKTISEVEMKREALIGFSKYTHDEIDAMSNEEVEKVYHDLFS